MHKIGKHKTINKLPQSDVKQTSLCIYTRVIFTSALYIFMSPELTLVHSGTPLIPHRVLECSANGPVFT